MLVSLATIFILALGLFIDSLGFRVSSSRASGLSFKIGEHQGIARGPQQPNALQIVDVDNCGPGEVASEASSSLKISRTNIARAMLVGGALGAYAGSPKMVWADDAVSLTREDVGFLSLNETEPTVTDVAFFDIKIGDSAPQRVEINLYGTVCPQTVANFKALCKGDNGVGYAGSEVFRVISTFSIQMGNIGCPSDVPRSRIGRYGKAANEPFLPENMRILHDSPDGGVVSMMKDLTNKGRQDSRFFITTSPAASWADNKYTAFGRVSKGLDFIKDMQVLPVVAPANYPETTIKIVKAGIL